MLWTALYLPQLSLDCYAQTDAQQPFAIIEKRRIHMANTAARAAGVRADQLLSAALALEPALQSQEREPQLEKAALDALSLWALQYTAAVSPVAPCGLLLETGGSARLFGGLDLLLKQIAAGVAEQGHGALLASAPTPAGALMLARSGYAEHVTTLPDLRRLLPGLPVGALLSAQAYAATFESLGARSVADLLALPRDGVKRRFGDFLLDELDRAFGHIPDPLRSVAPPTAFSTTLPLPAPAESSTAILYASSRGLRQLEGFLRAGKRAVDRIELTLHHERQSRHDSPDNVTSLILHLMQPSADAKRFTLLLTEQLNRHTLKRRVERITIAAPQLLRAEEITPSLLLEEEDAAKSMRDLLERLHARLGPEAVRQLQVKAEHRPEKASGDTPLLNTSHKPQVAVKKTKESLPVPIFGPRPAWFIDPPRPLETIGKDPIYEGPLRLQEPPERIESGWWDGEPIQREYFIAHTEEGRLLWIFRDERRENRWFLQGYFS